MTRIITEVGNKMDLYVCPLVLKPALFLLFERQSLGAHILQSDCMALRTWISYLSFLNLIFSYL
jgi:hypothetical protein